MPTAKMTKEEQESIMRDFLDGATYKDITKKYKRGSRTIHYVIENFRADWIDKDRLARRRRKSFLEHHPPPKPKPKRVALPDNIEEIARDFKNGMSYQQLREKYGYKQHQLNNFFKHFKAEWFDLQAISKEHSTHNRDGKKYDGEFNKRVYNNFILTLKSCGLSDVESWAVMNFIIRQGNDSYHPEQPTTEEAIDKIIKKTKLQSLAVAVKSLTTSKSKVVKL